MARGLRLAGITVAILLFAVITPESSGIGRGEPSVAVIVISPPPELALPVGQAIEVRYRVVGAASVLEFWSDDMQVAVDAVQPGQEVTYAWAPAVPRPHCLTVRALGERGTLLATAERRILGLPRGSPVRLRVEGEQGPCSRLTLEIQAIER